MRQQGRLSEWNDTRGVKTFLVGVVVKLVALAWIAGGGLPIAG